MNVRCGRWVGLATPSRLRRIFMQPWWLAMALLLALSACSPQPSATRPAQASGPAACMPAQLSLQLDDGNGRFNGMSHSGTMLVVRNAGTLACSIAVMPSPRLQDARRQTLAITAQVPPSPAGQPARLMLAPGASVDSDMRWVSGNVYDDGHCESPAFITLALGTGTVTAPFHGQLCGAGGKPSTYSITPFREAAMGAAIRLTYTCDDGRTVRVTYPDTQTAVLDFDAQTHRLHTAISADGARYVGGHWQWWSKGMHDAWLAELKPGEKIASAAGVACRAP
ncbi:MliC family protein [Rhodanobacter lindaniclasticus]|nr:MliC family protein [Rhodanobacter lindaniclasticus]